MSNTTIICATGSYTETDVSVKLLTDNAVEIYYENHGSSERLVKEVRFESDDGTASITFAKSNGMPFDINGRTTKMSLYVAIQAYNATFDVPAGEKNKLALDVPIPSGEVGWQFHQGGYTQSLKLRVRVKNIG